MKNYLYLFFIVFLFSCNKDDEVNLNNDEPSSVNTVSDVRGTIETELIGVVNEVGTVRTSPVSLPEITNAPIAPVTVQDLAISATETCLYSDLNIQANTTVAINCSLDLGGETYNIPAGVTLNFDGGTIFNGALNFESSGVIDGELLNSDLTVEGDVSLTNDEFVFYPERWGIVEGIVTQPVAFNNHVIIQETLDTIVEEMGASTFTIATMDAYFDTAHISNAVLTLPSNLNLILSTNTVLRSQPTDESFTSKMIKVYDDENVTISGGKIVGDRLTHGPTEGAGILVSIIGGRNIVVENMDLSLAGVGISVHGISWYDYPDQETRPYIASEDVIIRNNRIESCQFNNLSVTDGYRVIIDNNEIYNAGDDLQNQYYLSEGQAPRIGIVLEPAGDGIGYTQRIEDVTISNNIVDGTRTNSILAVGVYRVDISGNEADGNVGWTTAAEVTLTDNILTGAIIAGYYSPDDSYDAIGKSSNNVVANNIINGDGTGTGISVTSDDAQVFSNTITNKALGIMLRRFVDGEVYDNTIVNSNTSLTSWGINTQFFVNNVDVHHNKITLANGLAMSFLGINDEEGQENYEVNVYNNYFNSNTNVSVTNSNGIHFHNNNFENTGLGFSGTSNSSATNNTINSKTSVALGINRASGSAQNILIESNIINNISGNRLEGYGVRINTVGTDYITEESNVTITNNIISSLGENYGLHSKGFDDVTVINNTLETESTNRQSLYFIGNDSKIKDNIINSDFTEILIEGNNNISENNTFGI